MTQLPDNRALTTPRAEPLDYATPAKRSAPLWRSPALWALVIAIAVIMLALWSLLRPAKGAATERSRRILCASNLKQIGMGIVEYAYNNGGKFPPRLDVLIASGDLPPDVFVCPCSDDEWATGPTTQARLAEFAKKGHCSYVYLGAGMTSSVPANFVLAYEKPENHRGEFMNVLYGDGSVWWMDKQQLNHLISELKAGRNPPGPITRPAHSGGQP